jgi:nucleotide-binding universal stress UspA family protein
MSDLLRPDDWDAPVTVPDVGSLRRIVVAFDGSHPSELALAWADLLAAAADAEVVVLVAFESPLTKRGRGAAYVEGLRTELHDEATELATEAVAALTARGRTARAVVVRGEPAASVVQVAEDEAADLVVMGRRGLTSELPGFPGAVERLRAQLRGGVADRVALLDGPPVLVVG